MELSQFLALIQQKGKNFIYSLNVNTYIELLGIDGIIGMRGTLGIRGMLPMPPVPLGLSILHLLHWSLRA